MFVSTTYDNLKLPYVIQQASVNVLKTISQYLSKNLKILSLLFIPFRLYKDSI